VCVCVRVLVCMCGFGGGLLETVVLTRILRSRQLEHPFDGLPQYTILGQSGGCRNRKGMASDGRRGPAEAGVTSRLCSRRRYVFVSHVLLGFAKFAQLIGLILTAA